MFEKLSARGNAAKKQEAEAHPDACDEFQFGSKNGTLKKCSRCGKKMKGWCWEARWNLFVRNLRMPCGITVFCSFAFTQASMILLFS
jgi:hypothetical protein